MNFCIVFGWFVGFVCYCGGNCVIDFVWSCGGNVGCWKFCVIVVNVGCFGLL